MFSRGLFQRHPLKWQSMSELDEEHGMRRDLRLVRVQCRRTRGKEKLHAQEGKKEGGKKRERRGQ